VAERSYSNEALCLAVATVSDVGQLGYVLEELSRRDDDLFVVDPRMTTFISALTRHENARVREAALEVIAKRQLHCCIEAAYDALLRPESQEIWSTAAYAISQCPDDLDRHDADVLIRHTDAVTYRLRHGPCSGYVRERLQDAQMALLRAGTGTKR